MERKTSFELEKTKRDMQDCFESLLAETANMHKELDAISMDYAKDMYRLSEIARQNLEFESQKKNLPERRIAPPTWLAWLIKKICFEPLLLLERRKI
ncbi:hypothetical protein ACFL35_19565 [Candidatus Riflebacteria bacterium]